MTRILVPLEILEGQSVSAGLVDLLAPLDVTVLGYHVLPEQTPPDQARLQYEDRATDALEDLTAEFGDRTADHRLVFTHNRKQTFDRVAEETGATAYAIPGTTGPIERLLVALTGDVAVDRITSFVTALIGDRDIAVTLFLSTDDEHAGREFLESAAVTLFDRGLHVQTELSVDEPPLEALVDAATNHDAIVMGERAPSLRTLVFGEEAERVATESIGPVLVVRYQADETDSGDSQADETDGSDAQADETDSSDAQADEADEHDDSS